MLFYKYYVRIIGLRVERSSDETLILDTWSFDWVCLKYDQKYTFGLSNITLK